MVNKVQRRKALPADYWKWLPGGDKPLTRKTCSPATSIPSPLLSLICLPFFKTQVPSTLQTVPSASVMSFVMGIILPLVIIIMRPSFIKTQSPMGWPLLSTILPFCIVHSITAVLVFAQTGGEGSVHFRQELEILSARSITPENPPFPHCPNEHRTQHQ